LKDGDVLLILGALMVVNLVAKEVGQGIKLLGGQLGGEGIHRFRSALWLWYAGISQHVGVFQWEIGIAGFHLVEGVMTYGVSSVLPALKLAIGCEVAGLAVVSGLGFQQFLGTLGALSRVLGRRGASIYVGSHALLL
jgi:hypothetical protein